MKTSLLIDIHKKNAKLFMSQCNTEILVNYKTLDLIFRTVLAEFHGCRTHMNNCIYSWDRTCSAKARSNGVSISIEYS